MLPVDIEARGFCVLDEIHAQLVKQNWSFEGKALIDCTAVCSMPETCQHLASRTRVVCSQLATVAEKVSAPR